MIRISQSACICESGSRRLYNIVHVYLLSLKKSYGHLVYGIKWWCFIIRNPFSFWYNCVVTDDMSAIDTVRDAQSFSRICVCACFLVKFTCVSENTSDIDNLLLWATCT